MEILEGERLVDYLHRVVGSFEKEELKYFREALQEELPIFIKRAGQIARMEVVEDE